MGLDLDQYGQLINNGGGSYTFVSADPNVSDVSFNIVDPAQDITFTGNVTFGGGIVFGQSITEVVTADKDNFAIPNIDQSVLIRLDFQSQRNITGVIPPDITKSTLIVILNVGTSNGRLKNNDSASDPENRFLLKANILLQPQESAALIYDTISQRWRAFAVYK